MSVNIICPKSAILVQFVYHIGSDEAASMAASLHTTLNDDPAVPGLRIPTLFMPNDGTGDIPKPTLATEADQILLVTLADDYLAANAQLSSKSNRTWADYIVGLRNLCDQNPNHRFMPVQLTPHSWPIDNRLKDLNCLRAWAIDDEKKQRQLIARHIVQLLLRRLQSTSSSEDGPPLTIFLSHTKLDLDMEPHVVKSLIGHLTANQPQKTWFDSGDIEVGSRFAKEIEGGIKDAALLAVLTDSYSSRSWCRREVLLAKHFKRPVIVVNAVQDREVRSFPYIGNVPVVRWKGNAEEVIDVLLREALRQTYTAVTLESRKQTDDYVLPSGPELLTLTQINQSQKVLYPDPPLGSEELAIIEKTGIRIETPLERHAKKCDLRDKSFIVALSTSSAEDISRFGLGISHFEVTLLEISRYLLISGIRLSYGGHLGSDGYTVRLADLLRDPAVEYLKNADENSGLSDKPQLINYLPWPTYETVHARARLGSLVELITCQRPNDVDETMDDLFTDPVERDVPLDSTVRRFAWSRGLTEMRFLQTENVDARIAIGGRIGSPSNGYSGRMPGVLEEILLSIDANQPIFLIGAYGGCSHMVCEAFEGRQLKELMWDHHRTIPFSEELYTLYMEKGIPWEKYDSIFLRLREEGFHILSNGLTPEQNRMLAKTRSTELIIKLVLTGIQNICIEKEGSSK